MKRIDGVASERSLAPSCAAAGAGRRRRCACDQASLVSAMTQGLIVDHAPAAYAELGYAPGLLRDDDSVPDLDFGFFGKRTVRREQILRTLSKFGSVVNVFNFVPGVERDKIMRRARVIVQILETADGAFSRLV